jgi:hypothetical protein
MVADRARFGFTRTGAAIALPWIQTDAGSVLTESTDNDARGIILVDAVVVGRVGGLDGGAEDSDTGLHVAAAGSSSTRSAGVTRLQWCRRR